MLRGKAVATPPERPPRTLVELHRRLQKLKLRRSRFRGEERAKCARGGQISAQAVVAVGYRQCGVDDADRWGAPAGLRPGAARPRIYPNNSCLVKPHRSHQGPKSPTNDFGVAERAKCARSGQIFPPTAVGVGYRQCGVDDADRWGAPAGLRPGAARPRIYPNNSCLVKPHRSHQGPKSPTNDFGVAERAKCARSGQIFPPTAVGVGYRQCGVDDADRWGAPAGLRPGAARPRIYPNNSCLVKPHRSHQGPKSPTNDFGVAERAKCPRRRQISPWAVLAVGYRQCGEGEADRWGTGRSATRRCAPPNLPER